MDREQTQTFIKSASADLEAVRRNLLLIAQTGALSDPSKSYDALTRVHAGASHHGFTAVAALCAECERTLDALEGSPASFERFAFDALDCITRIEAALFDISPDDGAEIDALMNASLGGIVADVSEPEVFEHFEIDEETLDIFRDEADELLTNITRDLFVLSDKPGEQNALWNIRRHAHTFKGSAGIVGLKQAAAIAHRMEDLLDKMVETGGEAVPQVYGFLIASVRCLEAVVAAKEPVHDDKYMDESCNAAMKWLCQNPLRQRWASSPGSDRPRQTGRPLTQAVLTTPIVRVSLDRLDELIRLSQNIALNRSNIAENFAYLDGEAATRSKLEGLFAVQRQLTDELQSKLLHIRLVKFGTLETRFARAVNSTCVDGNKKADAVVENRDVEIDTQVIDALIEPLLHLIKNAVVHGIEPPQLRRMIGKPERGTIRIRLATDANGITLSVSDDGAGISISKLKAKAVDSGIISDPIAAAMDDREAAQLIFERGLTTAERIDLNAGRGVGMSIVKESVENRGGTISVESQPHVGTTFTIRMSEPPASAGGQVAGAGSIAANWPPAYAGGSDPLVLIVDDSASVRRHHTNLAEEAGMRVITASNGAEALELLLSGAHEPDLILTDIEMPQIDGWEFLEYIKTDKNFGHIPVVMVTSLEDAEHRKRAFECGAADYLIKPKVTGYR